MRSILRKIVLDILSFSANPSPHIHILNGHFVAEKASKVTKERFETFLLCLLEHFDVIGLEEAVNMIELKNDIVKPKVAITFDDGFLECYNVMFPVLTKLQLKAAFFVNPASIQNQENNFSVNFIKQNLRVHLEKKFMNWDMVREMQVAGHLIGSHTINHLELKGLSDSILHNEIVISKNIIEQNTGVLCDYFAFPFGTSHFFDDAAVKMASETYRYSFTSGLYEHYHHHNNQKLYTRRHFEVNWPLNHIKYFTSKSRM